MSEKIERYDFWKHGSGALVHHLETGESGLAEVRETAPEVLEVFVNWGSGPEKSNHRKLIVRGAYEPATK